MKLLIHSQTSTGATLGIDKKFHPTLYCACNYSFMLELNLSRISKRGSREILRTNIAQKYMWQVCSRNVIVEDASKTPLNSMSNIDCVDSIGFWQKDDSSCSLTTESIVSANNLHYQPLPCSLLCRYIKILTFSITSQRWRYMVQTRSHLSYTVNIADAETSEHQQPW